MAFSKKEKKSFFAGFFSGRKGKKKKLNSSSAKTTKFSRPSISELSLRYAEHMGRKFNLSKVEVANNAKKHAKQAKSDPEFRASLKREYGGY